VVLGGIALALTGFSTEPREKSAGEDQAVDPDPAAPPPA